MRKKNKVCNIGLNIFISLLNLTLKNVNNSKMKVMFYLFLTFCVNFPYQEDVIMKLFSKYL